MNRKLLYGVVAGLIATSAFAAPPLGTNPDRLVWGGAAEGSTYTDVYVAHVVDVLTTKARMSGYGWGGASKGTLENAAIVTRTPSNLAVGQYDLLKDLNGQPIPGGSDTYNFSFILGADGTPANLGPECLYIVTNQPGYEGSAAFGNVLADAWNMTLAVDAIGSGSAGTFAKLQGIYPDFIPDSVVHPQSNGALNVVNMVASGQATHAFFVQRPDPAGAVFKLIDEENLTIVPVVDIALEDAGYNFKELKVANGGLFSAAQTVATACTFVSLITGNPDLVTDPAKQKRVKETVARLSAAVTSEANVLQPSLSTWRDMWDNMKTLGGDKLKDLLEASRVAIENIGKNQ